jgi:hypothetical protein
MAQHGNLFCFAAACSAIKAAGYRFGTNKLRRALEVFKDDAAWMDAEELWLTAIDGTLKIARQEYMNTKRRKKIPTLSANNFFKSDAYIRPIFARRKAVSTSLVNLYANAMSS